MKPQADWAFCMGINRLVFHRYAHQPWLDRWPGMTMGPYGVHYERTQTWWPMVGAWHQYLARCQTMLRRGLPVADICYLAPEGAPHVFRPPTSALAGRRPVPDRARATTSTAAPETLLRATVKNEQLVLPGGTTYRVLVLPEMETMTPALLRKVRDLVRAGVTVIGPRPLEIAEPIGLSEVRSGGAAFGGGAVGDGPGRRTPRRQGPSRGRQTEPRRQSPAESEASLPAQRPLDLVSRRCSGRQRPGRHPALPSGVSDRSGCPDRVRSADDDCRQCLQGARERRAGRRGGQFQTGLRLRCRTASARGHESRDGAGRKTPGNHPIRPVWSVPWLSGSVMALQ